MNFLGIGPVELVIIIVIALIVLGPKGMTDLGRKAGRTVRKITRSPLWKEMMDTSRDINELPRKILREVDLDQEFPDIRSDIPGVTQPHNGCTTNSSEQQNK